MTEELVFLTQPQTPQLQLQIQQENQNFDFDFYLDFTSPRDSYNHFIDFPSFREDLFPEQEEASLLNFNNKEVNKQDCFLNLQF
jgi:hypothetical protein